MTANGMTQAYADARRALMCRGAKGAFLATLCMSLKPVIRYDIKTAATDGFHCFYNPTWFDPLPLEERVGVLVHETLHPVYMHHTRRNGRDLERWNRAADFALNPGLLKDGFKLPAGALVDSRFDGLNADVIYKVLEQEDSAQPQQKPQQDNGQGKGGQGDAGGTGGKSKPDKSGKPQAAGGEQPQEQAGQCADGEQGAASGNDPLKGCGDEFDAGGTGGVIDAAPLYDAPALAKAESDMQTRIRQAVAVAKRAGAGHLPDDIGRLVAELSEPVINWREALRQFIDNSQYKIPNWNRLNRRHIARGLNLPGMVPDRPSHIVAIIDASYSVIASADVPKFISEIQGAMDAGALDSVTLAFADTRIMQSETYNAGEQLPLEFPAGGGTSFEQPMAWVQEEFPNTCAVVYLTDADVYAWGEAPSAPVLWIVTGEPQNARRMVSRAPFGDAIILQD